MISEKRFAEEYNSFWNQLLPFSNRYVRSMNHFQSSFGTEVEFEGDGWVRAFVAEMAFCLGSWKLQGRDVFNREGVKDAYVSSKEYFGEYGHEWTVQLNETHLAAALEMGKGSYKVSVRQTTFLRVI